MNRIPTLLKFLIPALVGGVLAVSATAPAQALTCLQDPNKPKASCPLVCSPLAFSAVFYGACL